MRKSEIILKNLQIKSLKKAKLLCKALNIIEEETGIKEVKLTLENVFVCPWIDLNKLDSTPMENLLRKIVEKSNEVNS